MRDISRSAGVALAAILLSTASAHAISLNLGGGGPLVDLGSGSDAPSNPAPTGGASTGGTGVVDLDVDATVDLGGSDGGGLLGLGGNGSAPLLDVDTNDGIEATVNLDGDKDKEVIVDLFGSPETGGGASRVGQNGLINLGGDGPLVDLGGGDGGGLLGGDTPLLSVDTTDGIEATVDLGITGSTGPDAIVTLFGSGGDGPEVDVGLLDGGENGGADVIIDLFGPSTGNGSTPGTGGPGNGNTGRPGNNGNGTGNGTAGTGDGSGGNGSVVPTRPGTGTGGTAVRVAATGNGRGAANCFAPNEQQIANLLARVSFDAGDAAEWRRAQRVSLSAVELCADARAQLEAVLQRDGEFNAMRAAVAADANIVAALEPGHDANDVLAVDQSGSQLTVYVY